MTTMTATTPVHSTVHTFPNVSHLGLHWYDECDNPAHACFEADRATQRAVLAPIAAAYYAAAEGERFKAVIDAACGSSHCTVQDCWAAAMTALYGPIGLHDSYRDANDRPTAEARAKFPSVGEAMREAEAKLRRLLRVF